MKIEDALKKYRDIEIELLLSHAMRKPKEFLFMRPDYKTSPTQQRKLTRMIRRRRKDEPIAYILGYKDFCGLRFTVNRSVLIPRPETEELVELILKYLKSYKLPAKSFKLLDLGAGSGCIVISIAKQLKNSNFPILRQAQDRFSIFQFFASDISAAALKVAKKNAKRYSVKIKFTHSDLFKNLKGRVDVVVANLPYVPSDDYKKLKNGLRFEPKIALTDGKNTWRLYERLFRELPEHMKPGGKVFLEIDPRSRKKMLGWTKKYLNGANLKFLKDLSGRSRFAAISF